LLLIVKHKHSKKGRGNLDNTQTQTLIKIPQSLQACNRVHIKAGSRVFNPGDACNQFVYLLKGSIRVTLLSEAGNEVLLYRLGAHDTCVLTTSCLLGNSAFSAYAIAEEDIDLIAMPEKIFLNALNESEEFRHFVFSSFSSRLAAMMLKVEEVTFQSIGSRMAKALLKRPRESGKVIITHDELAAEIGTAREVISRKMAVWQKNGLVDKGRGYLLLIDVNQLQSIANSLD
jgi:CRP/FNR family transcriptional regulator